MASALLKLTRFPAPERAILIRDSTGTG